MKRGFGTNSFRDSISMQGLCPFQPSPSHPCATRSTVNMEFTSQPPSTLAPPPQAFPAPKLLSPHPAAVTQLKLWRDLTLSPGHFRLQMRRLRPREGHAGSHLLSKPSPFLHHRGPDPFFHFDFQQALPSLHHTQVTWSGLGMNHLTQTEPIGTKQSLELLQSGLQSWSLSSFCVV